MAKQLNVDLTFNADTSKAKQNIQDLQNAIQKLGYSAPSSKEMIDPAQFEKASAAARELAYHLNNAYNAKTGNIDLSKLHSSLKSANTNLDKLTSSFAGAGSTGREAFVALSRAIASADQPAITLNTHLSTMITTLKNVARFQLSSSIIHGLIGGVQQAFSYAKDLNQSLNNIRIVTGQNTEQMARFAEEANKSAKALSTTTLDYTKASLIYYQQGLDDKAVKARTDVTLKMANVSRQSAEEVSNQMTAIWNNFAKGGENLEYYADVITALGAATASSSQEIATGLEKFAAVADTVGLSYENATAALATITATTRQSAETVGTGLRTLFSRLQGLKLGETLEDGVDLNKYSKALQAVGVQALDASGDLRSMDDILEDLGERWQWLSDAQKTALAQTVGGVRQYTNLIALMDNFDFYKQNQGVAAGAEGTLQKQADIYAQSWEAARDRVKTAAEGIYDTLIDEDFFIKIDKIIESLLGGINTFLKEFGGIKPVIMGLLSFVLSSVSGKIGPAVQKIINDIKIMTGGASQVYSAMQTSFRTTTETQLASGNYNTEQSAELRANNELLIAKTKLGIVEKNLSAEEKMRYEIAIQGYQLQRDELKKLGEAADQTERIKKEAAEKAASAELEYEEAVKKGNEALQVQIEVAQQAYEIAKQQANVANQETGAAKGLLMNNVRNGTSLPNASVIQEATNGSGLDTSTIDQLNERIQQVASNIREQLVEGLSAANNETIELSNSFNGLFDGMTRFSQNPVFQTKELEQYKAQVSIIEKSFKNLGPQSKSLKDAFKQVYNAKDVTQYKKALEKLKKELKNTQIPGNKLKQILKDLGANPKLVDKYTKALEKQKKAVKAVTDAEAELKEIQAKTGADSEAAQKAQEKLNKLKQEAVDADKKAAAALEEVDAAQQKLNTDVSNFQPVHVVTGLEAITKTAAGFGQLAMSINAVKSIFQSWMDDDIPLGEKFVSTLMGISMAVPGIAGAFGAVSTVIARFTQQQTLANFAVKTSNLALQAENAEKAKSILLSADCTTKKGREAAVQALMNAGIEENTALALVNNSTCSIGNILKTLKIALLDKEKRAEAIATLQHIKETAAQSAQTGATWALVAAKVALKIAENPALGAVVLGLIVASTVAIIALTARTKKQTEAVKEQREAEAEAAQKTKDNAQAHKDLINTFEDALKAYREAKAEGEDLTQVQKDLAKAARDVAEAYGIQGSALAELSGNYDDFEASVYKAREEELVDLVGEDGKSGSADLALAAASDTMLSKATGKKMGKKTDSYGISNGYHMHFGDGFLGGADDQKIADIVTSGNYSTLSKQAADNSININTKFSAESMAKAYEDVSAVIAKAQETMTDAERKESDVYQAMLAWQKEMAESYQAYMDAKEDIKKYNIELADIKGINGQHAKDLETLEDYQAYREKLIKQQAQENGLLDENGKLIAGKQEQYDKLVKSVDAYLGSISSIASLKKQAEAVVEFNDIVGGDFDIQQWAKDNNVDLNLALQISPYIDQDLWDEELAVLKARIAEQEVLLKVSVADQADKLIENKDTTSADWAKWAADNNFDEIKDQLGVESLGEWLALSEEDKQKALTSYREMIDAEYEIAHQGTIEATQAQLEADEAYLEEKKIAYHRNQQLIAQYESTTNEELRENLLNSDDYKGAVQMVEAYEHVASNVSEAKQTIAQAKFDEEAKAAYGWYDKLVNKAKQLDLKTDEWAAFSKYISRNADKVDDLSDALTEDAEAANEVAFAWTRFKKGCEDASDKLEDWKTALDSNDVVAQAEAIAGLGDAYGNLLNIDGNSLSESFLKSADNMELLNTILYGTEAEAEAAYDKLMLLAQEDIANGLNMTAAEINNNIIESLHLLGDEIDSLDDIEIGARLDDEDFLNSLTNIINEAGMTADQATKYLASMGIDAEIEQETAPEPKVVREWVPGTLKSQPLRYGDGGGETFYDVKMANPGHWETHIEEGSTTVSGLKVKSGVYTGGGKPKIQRARPVSVTSKDKGSGNNGGGSSSKTSKPKTAEDRYHDKLNAKEKAKNAFDDAQEAKDKLWGQARVEAWEKAKEALDGYIQSQKELIKETEKWLAIDKKDMEDAFSKAGITIKPEFDENGMITNYEDILAQINNLYAKYNGDENMVALIEAAQKALEQYDKTSELYVDRIRELSDMEDDREKLANEKQIEPKERERYHRVERQLSENDRKLDEVRTKAERAHGLEKLKWLKEEKKLLEERNQLQQDYIDEIEETRKYLAEDQDKLTSELKSLGIDVELDENGEIANIEDIFDQLTNAWNNGDNSIFGTDPEKAQEKWDAIMEALSKYEDTLDLLHDKEKDLVDTENEIIDKALEIITTEIELKISISDRNLKRIDYAMKHIEDDVYKTAEALALMGKQGDESLSKIATYEKGIADILGVTVEEFEAMTDEEISAKLQGLSENNEEAYTTLEEYMDALREEKLNLLEIEKAIKEKVLAAYDELNAKVDEAYEKFDKFNGLLEHYKNILELSAGAMGPFTEGLKDMLEQTQIDNAKNQTEAARKRLEQAKKDLEEYTGDDPEMLKRLQENVENANEAFLSSIENTLQLMKDAYEKTFNDIYDNLDKWVQNAEKAYQRQKELNDQYLTDYEKTYQLNKLSRDLEKTLNNTNSAKGRARLLELQKEINEGMAEGNRMSAYDVEFLQKKLALEQARLDLENARNAKSYMQLQRGADGSWGYVYTASEEAVEQAEQAYEDRQHDLYELQKRQEESLTDQIQNLASSRSQAMRELESRRGDMTEDEYNAERQALEDHFKERARYMFEQMGNLFDNNDWAEQMYSMGLALGIDESTLQNILESNDLDEAMALFMEHFGDAQEASDAVYADYQDKVKAFFDTNGVTAETLQDAILSIGVASKDNVDDVTKASMELSQEFRNDVIAANKELAKLDTAINSITNKLDPLTERVYNLMNVLEGGKPMDLSGVDLTKTKDKESPSENPVKLITGADTNASYNSTANAALMSYYQELKDIMPQMLDNLDMNSVASAMDVFRGLLPKLPKMLETMLDQNVSINANFPSVVDHNQIEEAFNNLINKAVQYANRKNMNSQTFGDSYNY